MRSDDLARARAASLAGWRATADALPGGAWADLGDVQVHTSGLPLEQWNGAYVVAPPADLPGRLAEVAAWFAARGGLPYGVLVPEELGLEPPGCRLRMVQPVMLRDLDDLPGPPLPDGVVLERARDAEALVQVQAEAFGDPLAETRAFVAPTVDALDHLLARADGVPVGAATGVRTDGVVGVYGVAVSASWRRRGLGAALTARVLHDARAAGCDLAQLNPSDLGRGVYARLGFVDAPPYRVWVPES